MAGGGSGSDGPAAGGSGLERGAEGDATRTPDEVLARRVQVGEREAFAELARRYLPPVHAVVGSFLREPADVEDAAQETFLRALRGIRSFDPTRDFAPWIYQIARNVARNRIDANRRWRAEAARDDLVSDSPDPGSRLERREVRSLVEAALERMPERRRTAFRLFDIEGYAAAEVARLMGLSEGTVRSHVHHARRSLRAELETLLGEGGGR
jgi:RNA polymerase sigma-70 factor (ECF subfamily)